MHNPPFLVLLDYNVFIPTVITWFIHVVSLKSIHIITSCTRGPVCTVFSVAGNDHQRVTIK
jgi:hypothetical protein